MISIFKTEMIPEDDWGFFVDIEDYKPRKNSILLDKFYKCNQYTRSVNLYIYEKPINREIQQINDMMQWIMLFILILLTIKLVFL